MAELVQKWQEGGWGSSTLKAAEDTQRAWRQLV